MREKDIKKQTAIFEATVDLLLEIGFTDISMSKIAKKAGVSASTIYTYYQNKEDMLIKVYRRVEEDLYKHISAGIRDDMPMREAVYKLVSNVAEYVRSNSRYYYIFEQFSYSPLIAGEGQQSFDAVLFGSLRQVFAEAARRKEVKEMSPQILIAYCFQPVAIAARRELSYNSALTEDTVQMLAQMSWDAVRNSAAE